MSVLERSLAAVPDRLRPAWLSGYVAGVAGVTLVGLALRLAFLGLVPLWRDEAFSAVVAQLPWDRMFAVLRVDSAPPLSYVLVKLFSLVSTSPFSLRLVAALAGVAAVPVAAALGRRLGGDRSGIAAGAVVAAMPSLVLVSRDLRMYSLATTLLLVAALLLWRAAERPTWARAALFGLCAAACLYTHYLTAIGLAGEFAAAIVVLGPSRAALLRMIAAGLLAGVSLLPWLAYASAQFAHTASPFWAGKVSLAGLGGIFVHFAGGSAISASEPAFLALNILRALAVTAAFVALVTTAVWLVRVDSAGARRGAAYLVAATAIPVALLSAVSVVQPIFDARYALPYAGPIIVAVAAGLGWPAARRLAVAVPALLAVIALPIALTVANPDIPGALGYLSGRLQPSDELILTGARHYFPIEYYADPATAARVRIVSRRDLRWFDGTADIPASRVFHTIPDSAGRIVVVGDPGFSDRLPAGFRLQDKWCGFLVCVQTFSR